MFLPKARKDGLHITPMGGEVLAYDPATTKAHYLNPTTARVWALCDGIRDTAAIARNLAQDTGVIEAGPLVELALEQLGRRGLLEEAPAALAFDARPARRDALRKLVAAAALIPAVLTVTASPARALDSSVADVPIPCPASTNPCQRVTGVQPACVTVNLVGIRCTPLGGGPGTCSAGGVCVGAG